MKVIIAGIRYKDREKKIVFDDYSLIEKAVERSGYNITEVVSGRAIGADRLGEKWAEANSIPIKKMPADWNRYGKAAGHKRNGEMEEYADAAIVIWDGVSAGSRNMIDHMIRAKKPHYVQLTSITLEDFM